MTMERSGHSPLYLDAVREGPLAAAWPITIIQPLHFLLPPSLLNTSIFLYSTLQDAQPGLVLYMG